MGKVQLTGVRIKGRDCHVRLSQRGQVCVYVHRTPPSRRVPGEAGASRGTHLGGLHHKRLEQVKLAGAREGLGSAVNTQLGQDVVDVLLHGADAQDQGLGDTLVGSAGTHEP